MTILEEGAGKAREVLAKVRPGPLRGRRSLPIRAGAAEIERAWASADGRAAVLEGIPAADVWLDFGPELQDWGTVVTVTLQLKASGAGDGGADAGGQSRTAPEGTRGDRRGADHRGQPGSAAMRALCWMGVNDLQVKPSPTHGSSTPHDAILKVRLTTTCGSDLHLLGGYVPTMREGDVIGREYMGEVVEVAPERTTRLQVGDRVVVQSFIGCGRW